MLLARRNENMQVSEKKRPIKSLKGLSKVADFINLWDNTFHALGTEAIWGQKNPRLKLVHGSVINKYVLREHMNEWKSLHESTAQEQVPDC